MRRASLAIVLVAAVATATGSAQTPAPAPEWLLAKAAAAFERNRAQERFWIRTSREQWFVADSRGFVLQRFPAITVESVIRKDGSRCNAVVQWGDGVPGHLLNGPEEVRCDAVEASNSDTFDVAALLTRRRVQQKRGSSPALVLTVFEQNHRARTGDKFQRCAGAIRATLVLDPVTYFPQRIEGQVMDDGCDEDVPMPPTYYGTRKTTGRVTGTFVRGSTFRYEYEPQSRFSETDETFWLLTRWSYDQPVSWTLGSTFIYWGRQIPYRSPMHGERLVVETAVTGQQFGVTSSVIIKK